MAKKLSAFEKAFASERKKGSKTFQFGGKSYNTKLKGEDKPKSKSKVDLPKSAPTPTARPSKITMTGNSGPSSRYTPKGKSEALSRSPAAKSFYNPPANPVKPIMSDMVSMNDFKDKESRRSSDYSIGKANAPNVKRAIGKFALGKGYKG